MSSPSDSTPLLDAVRSGSVQDVRKQLLAAGARSLVNEKSRISGETALHVAVRSQSLEMVKLLLLAGATDTVNALDIHDLTPFKLSLANGNRDIVLALMISKGDVFSVRQERNRISDARITRYFSVVFSGVNARKRQKGLSSVEDDCPLLVAVRAERVEEVHRMLVSSSQIHMVNGKSKTRGETPMHVAVRNQNVEIVKLLLLAGAKYSINTKDRTGYSPYMLGVMSNCYEIVEILSIAGARIYVKNGGGRNMTLTPLEYAIDQCDLRMVKILILADADFRSVSPSGLSVLHVAATDNDPELTEALARRGADLNARDSQGRVPLHYAVINSHIEVFWILLSYGADARALDTLRQTPNHYLRG